MRLDNTVSSPDEQWQSGRSVDRRPTSLGYMTVQTRCISAFETHNNIPSLLSFNNLCPIPRTHHLIQPFNKTNRADKHKVPETKNTEEGSARRNITRKHDQDPHKWVFSLPILGNIVTCQSFRQHKISLMTQCQNIIDFAKPQEGEEARWWWRWKGQVERGRWWLRVNSEWACSLGGGKWRRMEWMGLEWAWWKTSSDRLRSFKRGIKEGVISSSSSGCLPSGMEDCKLLPSSFSRSEVWIFVVHLSRTRKMEKECQTE